MKTLTFTYTKKDGSVSQRTLLAQVMPGDKYAGIDLSELDPEDAAAFVEEAKKLHSEYVEFMLMLQHKYDLKYAFKQFLAAGLSEITEI